MNNKKVLVEGSDRSFERSIGWDCWSLWMEACRWDRSGGLEKSRDNAVTPVPPGTALHQLYSVPPTGRDLASGGDSVDIWCD